MHIRWPFFCDVVVSQWQFQNADVWWQTSFHIVKQKEVQKQPLKCVHQLNTDPTLTQDRDEEYQVPNDNPTQQHIREHVMHVFGFMIDVQRVVLRFQCVVQSLCQVMCSVGVSDEEPYVTFCCFIDFLKVLESYFEPYFCVFMIEEIVCDVGESVMISLQRWCVEERLENVHVIEVLLEVRLECEVHFCCVFLVKYFQSLVMFHDSEVEDTERCISVIRKTIVPLFDHASTVTTITWDCVAIITLFSDCDDLVTTWLNTRQVRLTHIRNVTWQTLTYKWVQLKILL